MISRIFSAALRGMLVACVVVFPALMLPAVSADGAQISVLIALLAAMFVFLEYVSSYPSFVEFRHAPPFNRMRYVMLLMLVVCMVFLCRNSLAPGLLGGIIAEGASTLGRLFDLPYSPVRIFVLGMPAGTPVEELALARDAAALCYALSVCSLISFVLLVNVYDWPSRNGAFNVWVNLPLFDPTTGGDVLPRLRRDGYLNIAAGIILPYLIPLAFRLASGLIDAFSPLETQSFVWTMVAWSFIPASMIMRGVAMCRVADLIQEKRRRAYARTRQAG